MKSLIVKKESGLYSLVTGIDFIENPEEKDVIDSNFSTDIDDLRFELELLYPFPLTVFDKLDSMDEVELRESARVHSLVEILTHKIISYYGQDLTDGIFPSNLSGRVIYFNQFMNYFETQDLLDFDSIVQNFIDYKVDFDGNEWKIRKIGRQKKDTMGKLVYVVHYGFYWSYGIEHVKDHEDLVNMKNALTEAYNVRVFFSESKAIEVMEKVKPSIILLNLGRAYFKDFENLYNRHFELLKYIKINDNLADVPVVVMPYPIGYEFDALEEMAYKNGASDFIKGPYSNDELLNRIKNHIK